MTIDPVKIPQNVYVEDRIIGSITLGGRLVAQFVITGTGTATAVSLASSTVGDARVESCVLDAVRRWQFPRPSTGGVTVVSYPFVFVQPGGDDQNR